MSRVKRGQQAHRRHKRVLKQTEGFWGGRKNRYRQAIRVLWKSWQYAYVGRKLKKRENRGLQQMRIGAASRELGVSYSKLMGDLKKRDISLNRVVLSEIAAKHPNIFAKIAKG